MNNVDLFLSTCITKENFLLFSFWAVEHCVKKLEHYLEITKMEEKKGTDGIIDFGNISIEPFVIHKEIFKETSPRSPLSTKSSIDFDNDGIIDVSIENLYQNVHNMQSSDYSCGDYKATEVTKEVVLENENNEKSKNKAKACLDNTKSLSSVKFKKPPSGKKMPNGTLSMKNHENDVFLEEICIGSYLLKQSRDLISSGGNPQNALDLALRVTESFDKCVNGKPNLELVMCLHFVSTLYCKLGNYKEAINILERAIDIPMIDEERSHALAKFAGCMQLGDTYAMMGQIKNSISYYFAGLDIQKKVLGEKDPRFGETCRYIAEAHLKLLQFDEAEKLCQLALDIHWENGEKWSSPSLQEAFDRRLMGIICDSKGNYEIALEHYVLAHIAMLENGHEKEAAAIDISIGDVYLSLNRYEEAIFTYEKALKFLKLTEKKKNEPSLTLLYVRLADTYNKIGKYTESKYYCERAICIYSKPFDGIFSEEIFSGLIDISAIYESMNEFEQALKLLKKATKIYENVPGQQSTMALIEARIGMLYYFMGSYFTSYDYFKNAISKFREIGEKKSAIFGLVLNQMGLVCVRLNTINEAKEFFEESRVILESENGPHHSETLGVCSNLAGTYDAMGRSNDAIEILEFIVGMREQKLGTANPDGDDEKRRLMELLKESGKVRNRKSRSLETLLETNYQNIDEDKIKEL